MKGLMEWFEERESLLWLLVITIPLAILGIAYALAPEAVWDGFIWKYYVAPVEADAQDHPVDGITESYNPVDTATYGIVLVLSVLAIYRLMKRLGVQPGKDLVFATVPYILLGGVLRSLEDSGLFTGRNVYLFIAPIIYILIGLLTVLKLFEAHLISETSGRGPDGTKRALLMFIGVHIVWNIIYGTVYTLYLNDSELLFTGNRNLAYILHPGISILLSASAVLALMICQRWRKRIRTHDVMAIFGWHFLVLTLFHAAAFIINDGRWPGTDLSTSGMNLFQLALVPVLALAATLAFLAIVRVMAIRYDWVTIYWRNPVNMLIMFCHLLDAAATFTALQFFTYGEKHVLPNLLIGLTGTPAVMFPLKAGVMAFIVYVLDVELRRDLEEKPLLKSLVWIAIVVLGLAPGTRDLMRLAMGV